jgi:enamine deaminase RidA (YjgF/YER057c/UK114 family)
MTSLLRPDGLVQSPAFSHVGKLVGGDDVAAQTQQVMKNLHVALAAAGVTVHDLDADLTAAYPVAAAELAGAAPTVVAARVASLAVPGALLEVSAIAAVTS